MTWAWLAALLTVFTAWLGPAQAQVAGQVAGQAGGQAAARAVAVPGARAPNIAFHYGSKPPVDALQAFDIAVVEPDSGFDPRRAATPGTDWFAYVSVGEVEPSRSYLKDLPKAWLTGNNDAWGARVVDQAAPGWPPFYVDKVIAPLWERGYRGFFLDTLDSYQLVAKTDAARASQEAGMVAVIRAIKARYPDARLIFNRGFEILPQVHQLAYAVAFESLYRGWDQGNKRYTEVSEADRNWLLGQARIIREQYRLPVISIDYCPPADRKCARDTAARIRALDIIPYVADPGLQAVGIGAIEVMPRRVLVVQDREAGVSIDDSAGVRFVAMPLNYLGYRVDFAEASQPLPEIGPDRYAGVVVWMGGNVRDQPGRFSGWIQRMVGQGIPVVFLNDFGARIGGSLASSLQLNAVKGKVGKTAEVVSKDPMMGFEMPVAPDRTQAAAVQVGDGPGFRSLLRLRSGTLTYDAAAITPWGGYVLGPYAVRRSANDQNRWVVQPLDFLREALRLPAMPVPDVTTENARRLLTIHVDGDGFASRAEIPGGGFSGEVLFREIWDRYRLPMTMSIIQGEVASDGMYPKLTAQLEPIARKIFAQPYVEVASHTYSHPFEWGRTVPDGTHAQNPTEGDDDYHLAIPGYQMDLRREIGGSIDYINRTLAPASKPVSMLLWSGDCQPPPEAIKLADQAGVLNMNGGDTLITRSNPSWTAISPIGVNKADGTFQVFAPNQNENVYTNLWHGPFYGFERVIETYELTDRPYRFKSVNIYYHSYSGTKAASLKALRKVYDYALNQPLMPVHASDYARKVIDWQGMAVAREIGAGGDGRQPAAWIVRGDGNLRNVRWTGAGVPDVAGSHNVTGTSPAPGGGVYVHLVDGASRIVMRDDAARMPAVPEIVEASGFVRGWRRGGQGSAQQIRFDFSGYTRPFFRLAGADRCRVAIDGKAVAGVRERGTLRFDTTPVSNPGNAKQSVEITCGA
ncbi:MULTISPECIES: bifunctional glycoside hydrolase 114/ polysaccharide deacetylase family protein [unclassified Cupriavidus]|uniref:bifunctional glycoside hydrolase 114/ polysaccharide deacetylase family protein n=1 Tax=unclassified Cupriavidus TaxID=2640874 RepID=UPI003F8FAE42